MGFSAGFKKIALEAGEEPSSSSRLVVPAAAGALAYAALRRRRFSGRTPADIAAASKRYGFARVHLHEKNPSRLRKYLTEVLMPADRHVHLSSTRSYIPGKRFKGTVFDPESTGYFKTPHLLGKSDSTSRAISKSKLQEYRLAKKMGLRIPKTTRLGKASKLKSDEIAKPARGSQAKIAITKKDIAAYNPDSLALRGHKMQRALVKKLMRSGAIDENAATLRLNKAPGYREWLTEQAIRHPENFVKQTKVNIADEYRVHTFRGKAMGISSARHNPLNLRASQAERAAEKALRKVSPELSNNMLAMDVARDTRGRWHVIETNPGPESGFLSPTNPALLAGPQKLYRYATGRYSRPAATAGGIAAAGATAVGQAALGKKKEEPNT